MHHRKDTIIIGAGLTGLVIGHKLKHQHPGHQLMVIEKSARTGGVISSFKENGYLAESGPHGFLDNCIESRELLQETGLETECVRASLQTFVRYVCIDSKLMMIPQSPLKIIRAPLIPWKDKFRVAGELFKEPLAGEPTVAKWAEYRFGKALLPYVDAVFTGTYAGDYNELKIDAVMPGVRQMEQEHGSIIRGVLAKIQQARKKKGNKQKLSMPSMTSFPDGMARLPQRLAEILGPESISFNCEVTGIQKDAKGWLVETVHDTYQTANLVLALPVNQGLRLLTAVDDTSPLQQIPEAWIATVVFGFEGATLPPGFGFLIPEREQRFTLGTLFSSNMFPNRAPNGHIIFETLVGGRRHPERLELDDETLIQDALTDVKGLLALPHNPTYTRVLRPAGGIPQLEKGYPQLLKWRNDLVRENPGLYVCGFGWEGIGLNDMIKTACSVGETIISQTTQIQEQAEAKKIYF
ncbi:MAG: protoporphyrinogen oxidase [Desulfobulbaceae bacterium]|nr:MAG: protoporphyrinogen oxidase [Desulfobulbaceae bacterium]